MCGGRAHLTFRSQAFIPITEVKLTLTLYLKNISPPHTFINTFFHGFCLLYNAKAKSQSAHLHVFGTLFSHKSYYVLLRPSVFLWVFPTFVFLVVLILQFFVAIYFPSFSLHMQTIIIGFVQLLLIWCSQHL